MALQPTDNYANYTEHDVSEFQQFVDDDESTFNCYTMDSVMPDEVKLPREPIYQQCLPEVMEAVRAECDESARQSGGRLISIYGGGPTPIDRIEKEIVSEAASKAIEPRVNEVLNDMFHDTPDRQILADRYVRKFARGAVDFFWESEEFWQHRTELDFQNYLKLEEGDDADELRVDRDTQELTFRYDRRQYTSMTMPEFKDFLESGMTTQSLERAFPDVRPMSSALVDKFEAYANEEGGDVEQLAGSLVERDVVPEFVDVLEATFHTSPERDALEQRVVDTCMDGYVQQLVDELI